MATYRKEYGYTKVRRRKQKYSILERVVDFSKLPITNGMTITTAWAADDVLELIGIRAGQTVLHVECEILKRDVLATAFVQIGDGDNVSRWGTLEIGGTKSTTKKANMVDALGVDFYGAPKYYGTKDTIDLTLGKGATLTTARIKLIVHVLEDDR